MLKVLETIQQRLVVKEVRSTYDAKILAILNYSAIYLLLFFTLRLWSKLYPKSSLSEYIYDILTHPLFTYFYVITLFVFSVSLLFMLPLGSCFQLELLFSTVQLTI